MRPLVTGRRKRGGSAAPAGGAPFFTDNLQGGVSNNANGVTWAPQGLWSVSNDTGVNGGTHAWKATFGPDATDTNGAQSSGNLQFNLGRDCGEFGAEWYLWIPSNYTHRNNPSTSDNNKFLGLFRDSINNNDAWRMVCEADHRAAAGSETALKAAEPNSGSQVVFYQEPGSGVAMANTAGALMTLGAWNRMRLYFKQSSADNVRDGVLKWWINDTLVGGGKTNGDYWSWNRSTYPDGAKVNLGYFMGASNSGFTDATTFYIADVKFYDSNPGW